MKKTKKAKKKKLILPKSTPKHFSYPVDLVEDMRNSPRIQILLSSEQFAGELYAALCNMRWTKVGVSLDELCKYEMLQLIGEGKSYTFDEFWSTSWRSAGGIVANLRNKFHDTDEHYMNWYCGGKEGTVSERVGKILGELGWVSSPWPDAA